MRQTNLACSRHVAWLGVLVLLAGCGGSAPTAPTVDPSVLPSMDLMLAEKALGDASAPNTIIEYSSFTCSHCGDFHVLTLPQLKATYIDTRLVRFVFRNSPRDTTVDLTAAMLARCAGDRYFDAVDTLFNHQAAWTGTSDPSKALDDLMRTFGLSQAVIDACKASTTLKAGVLKMKSDGLAQWGYQGIPAFIVNETKLVDGFKYLSDFAPYLH